MVTAGLAESNGSLYRRVYDSRHLQADCQEPGSAPLVIEYGLPLPFYLLTLLTSNDELDNNDVSGRVAAAAYPQ